MYSRRPSTPGLTSQSTTSSPEGPQAMPMLKPTFSHQRLIWSGSVVAWRSQLVSLRGGTLRLGAKGKTWNPRSASCKALSRSRSLMASRVWACLPACQSTTNGDEST